VEGSDPDLIYGSNPRICLEGIRNTMKIAAKIFRVPANFRPGMSEYKSEIFLLEPSGLVFRCQWEASIKLGVR
jgi:hypothetical protein